MKLALHFLGTIAIIAVQAIVISAVCSVLHWLFTQELTWKKFIGGTLGIFLLLLIWAVFNTIRELYRFHKDPEYKHAYLTLGIKWDDYQRLKKKTDNGNYVK